MASPSEALDQPRLTHLVDYAASRAAISLRKLFTRHFEPLDLKVVDFSIPVLVAANPEVKQRQVGDALEISPPDLAVMIDRIRGAAGSSACAARATGARCTST